MKTKIYPFKRGIPSRTTGSSIDGLDSARSDSANSREQDLERRGAGAAARTRQTTQARPAAQAQPAAPRTRGQKRCLDDATDAASEFNSQWWRQGASVEEVEQTHTGKSPRAPVTRSSTRNFNMDELVEMEKYSWPEQTTVHHAGMGAVGLSFGIGPQPSEEAEELLERHAEAQIELGRDTVSALA